jgi:hypothetical protein
VSDSWGAAVAAVLVAHRYAGTDGAGSASWAVCSCGWRGPLDDYDNPSAPSAPDHEVEHAGHVAARIAKGIAGAVAASMHRPQDVGYETLVNSALRAFAEASKP